MGVLAQGKSSSAKKKKIKCTYPLTWQIHFQFWGKSGTETLTYELKKMCQGYSLKPCLFINKEMVK